MTLRLLCHENVPRTLVAALRMLGHDTAWISELAARSTLPEDCGVILLRLTTHPPAEAATRIAALLDARRDWAGHLSVIEPGRTRMRRLEAPPL